MAFELLKEANAEFYNQAFSSAEALYTSLIKKYSSKCNDSRTKLCLHEALNNRGQIKYLRVDFKEAISDFTQALTFKDSEISLYNRGLIHYRLGRYTQAIGDFNASLKLKPNFKDSIEALEVAKLEQSSKTKQDV